MSDALREAIRFNSGDKVRKKACAAILEQTVMRISDILAQVNQQMVEVQRLIDGGDREGARVVALKGRDALQKSRLMLRDDIHSAVCLLQGEDRREAIKLFGPLYEKLVEVMR